MKFNTPIIIMSALLFISFQLANCSGASSSDGDSSGNPVAKFTASPTTAVCGQAIQFDGGESIHQNPSFQIAGYEWDFDYNGSVFTEDDTGKVVSHVFNSPGVLGTHTVALRVSDNRAAPYTDVTSSQIEIAFSNRPPVSDAGGPYTAYKSGELPVSVTLDGSGSYDTDDPCDEVSQYKWDTDGDGLFGADDTDGTPWSSGSDLTGESPVIENADWSLGVTYPVQLIVTDCYGLESPASDAEIKVVSQ